MCCRYYMEMSPDLREIIEEANRASLNDSMVNTLGKPFKTEGEIRPTDMVPVIASSRSGDKRAFPMVWGYHVAGLSQPVVNARSETARDKRAFKDSWASHRCVIPASWYYEWEHLKRPDGKVKTGDKYLIQSKGSGLAWLAGLYRIEETRGLSYPVFTILTREASADLQTIHDRMPLILPGDAIDAWINPKVDPHTLMRRAVTDMIFERAAG